MAYKIVERNMDRIQYESIRKKVDAKYNLWHDELSKAYYDYWKHGKSYPWKGYDVKDTPEESKAQFDKLHGLIFLLHEKALYEQNIADGKPYQKLHDYMTGKEEGETRTRYQKLLDKISTLESEGYKLQDE